MYLDAIVGLTGATEPGVPSGGLLVNDLAGIPGLRIAEHTVDQDGLNKLWTRVLKNAEQELERSVRSSLKKDTSFSEVLAKSKYPVSAYDEDVSYTHEAGKYIGSRVRCRNVKGGKLSVLSVTFELSEAATPVCRIIDLSTGEVKETVTATEELAAGVRTLAIGKEIDLSGFRNDYAIVLDSDIGNYKDVPQGENYEAISDISISVEHGKMDNDSGTTKSDWSKSSRFLYVDFSIESNYSSICEQNADLLKEAAQHLAGSYLLEESSVSTDFSLWTNTNHIQRQEMKGTYYGKAMQYIANVRLSLLKRIADFAAVQYPEESEIIGNTVGSFV